MPKKCYTLGGQQIDCLAFKNYALQAKVDYYHNLDVAKRRRDRLQGYLVSTTSIEPDQPFENIPADEIFGPVTSPQAPLRASGPIVQQLEPEQFATDIAPLLRERQRLEQQRQSIDIPEIPGPELDARQFATDIAPMLRERQRLEEQSESIDIPDVPGPELEPEQFATAIAPSLRERQALEEQSESIAIPEAEAERAVRPIEEQSGPFVRILARGYNGDCRTEVLFEADVPLRMCGNVQGIYAQDVRAAGERQGVLTGTQSVFLCQLVGH